MPSMTTFAIEAENERRKLRDDEDCFPMEIIDEADYMDLDSPDAEDAFLEWSEQAYWETHRISWDDTDRPFIVEDDNA